MEPCENAYSRVVIHQFHIYSHKVSLTRPHVRVTVRINAALINALPSP